MKPALLKPSEMRERLKLLPDWMLSGGQLTRTYEFSDFVAAMAFVNHVAAVSEGMDHHPDIDVRYRRVTLAVSTHSVGGITELDFTLAQRIDG